MKKATITWTVAQRRIGDLIPADYNPRKMSEQERRDLEESIDEFGKVMPIVINIGTRNNVLIGGHQRVILYKERKVETVDVMVPSRELTIAEEKRLNLRLNKNTGSWDFDKLRDMGLSLLLDVGFGDEEMSTMFDDVDVLDDEFNFPRAVKAITEVKSRPGDIYRLGDHRLMCGDGTDEAQVAKLMGKDHADVIYCDPPASFEVPLKDEKNKEVAYARFLDASLKAAVAHAKPNFHAFYWGEEKYLWLLQTLYRDNKIENKRVCLWIKNDLVITAKVAFNKSYQPCVYGTRGKPKLNPALKGLGEVLNKEIESGNQIQEEILEAMTIWLARKPKDDEPHGSWVKPVTLAERPLKRCSAPGDVVLDLFGGSGSTLIAAEQIKRSVRMMELDPIHCDVIINRWETLTNKKAKKL